jgi:hypothetical protein
MRRMNLVSLAVVCTMVVAGCTAGSKLTSAWTEPGFQPNSLKKLMVLGISQRPGIRQKFEDTFAAALNAQGVAAVASYTLLGDGVVDSIQTSSTLQQGGFDGVFVTRVVDRKTVDTYYPPTSANVGAPSAYHSGWHGYYSSGYAQSSSPGYNVQDQVVNLETNLYRVSDGKLAWSALSERWLEHAADPSTEIKPFVHQLVHGLESSKVVSKTRN